MHIYHKLIVKPGVKVDLESIDADGTPGLVGSKEEKRSAAEAMLEEHLVVMEDLQYRLWAQHEQSLLIVLQGMDTAGKDGTIRHTLGQLNPQGVQVTSFKKPTQEQLDHDFLWRVHRAAPGHGQIGVFNRSHYEDVLVVRVHGLVPKRVWSRRYEQINAFESQLRAHNTTILKFFLHISSDEQKERLQARLDDPKKNWKFSRNDLTERGYWKDYQQAYKAVLEKTSTDDAPWFVIPANRKWYRNWAVATIIRDALEKMDPQTPKADFDPTTIRIV